MAKITSEPQRNGSLRSSYDDASDVLYISLGAPRPAESEEHEGLLLRYDMETDDFCGVTVLSYGSWRNRRDDLIDRLATLFNRNREDVDRILPASSDDLGVQSGYGNTGRYLYTERKVYTTTFSHGSSNPGYRDYFEPPDALTSSSFSGSSPARVYH